MHAENLLTSCFDTYHFDAPGHDGKYLEEMSKRIVERKALHSAAKLSQRVGLFERNTDRELATDLLVWKNRQDKL